MPLGADQPRTAGVVLEVRARRVAPGVAAAPVLLAEQPVQARPVLAGKAPLLADAPVPVLGQSLGHLDRKPVQVQVIAIAVARQTAGPSPPTAAEPMVTTWKAA